MERLGYHIFLFFFFGLTFFERVRTKGETGNVWLVLLRNLLATLLAVAVFLLVGADIGEAGSGFQLFATAHQFISTDPTYEKFSQMLLPCLFCAAATLIVTAGIWELNASLWKKCLSILAFCLLVYPLFARIQSESGYLGMMGFHDHAGALLIWALPATFVLGIRSLIPGSALPTERVHDLKGYKILPGMKHRFLLSRGIGFTMVFLVLNAPTLLNHKWVISKTLTLIPASITMLFCNFLFFGLFGKNKMERLSYAPPIFAVMATLVATQACIHYNSEQAVFASIATTFVTLLYLRHVPLQIQIWDPICSLPIFMVGGFMGIVMASITTQAEIIPQLLGIFTCLVVGLGSGCLLSLIFRNSRPTLALT